MRSELNHRSKLSIWKKILFSITVIVISLFVAGRISKLLLKKQYILQLGIMSTGRVEDRFLFWRLQNHFSEPNLKIKTNSWGFRDDEFSRQKPANTTRIACLGDSVTFGWKVPQHFSYPDILEDTLNFYKENKRYRFEVLNMGIPGYSSFQGRIFTEREVFKYSPDIIIFSFGINDSQVSMIPDKENYYRNTSLFYWVRKILDKSNLYLYIKQIWINRVKPVDKREAREKFHRVSVDQFKVNIQSVIDAVASQGVSLVLLNQANTGRNYLLQPYFDIEKQMAQQNENVYYADAMEMLISFNDKDLMPYLKTLAKKWPAEPNTRQDFFGTKMSTPDAEKFSHLMGDPVHPNTAGCAILGIQLADFLNRNKLVESVEMF